MSSDVGGWGFLILVAVAVIGIAWMLDAAWLYKWWYTRGYHLPNSQISLEHRPRDCDFWCAPIGKKDCHYMAVVTPNSSSTLLGAPPATHVDITWEKVQD